MTRTSLHWEKWGEKNNKLTYPSLDILKDLLPLEENTGSTNKLHWSLENCSSFVKAQRTQALRGPTNSGKMPNPKQAISQRPISSALNTYKPKNDRKKLKSRKNNWWSKLCKTGQFRQETIQMASSRKREESLLANTQKKQIYPLMRPANSTQTMWVSQNGAALVSSNHLVYSRRKKNNIIHSTVF